MLEQLHEFSFYLFGRPTHFGLQSIFQDAELLNPQKNCVDNGQQPQARVCKLGGVVQANLTIDLQITVLQNFSISRNSQLPPMYTVIGSINKIQQDIYYCTATATCEMAHFTICCLWSFPENYFCNKISRQITCFKVLW